MLKTAGMIALSTSLVLGFASAAGAASSKREHGWTGARQHHAAKAVRHHPRYVTDQSGIGRFVLAPGDSKALIERSYPYIDANPPSLRQTYNLRGRTMSESRN